jgi:hypothetical protein
MKTKMSIIFLMMLVFVSSENLLAMSPNDMKGTWEYEASPAPYEYSKGKLVISEKDGQFQVALVMGTSTRNMTNVKAEGNELSFGTYLEGEYISVKIKFNKNAFTGTATYSDGKVTLTGKKA